MTRLNNALEPLMEPADGGGGSANRRTVLKAGATAIGLGAIGMTGLRALAQEGGAATATTEATARACVLTPELTEGPYYVEEILLRSNIVEDRAGVPLRLTIAVQDPTSCIPLANAAVDIWHCDANGYYSGISGENPGGGAAATGDENLETTFLRGVQLTDEDGVATFETIYPGWYTGRAVHIHMKVHVDGEAVDGSYDGGHVAHTGQLFFDDAISDAVYLTSAYSERANAQRLYNDGDNILGDHDDEPGFMLELTPLVDGSIEEGFLGTITIGVDPSATPSEAGMGGGPNEDGRPSSSGPGDGGPPPSN
ncbi:MAG: intradiol ring-cleavage dioxygenase [Thermomicrobiales bacterium]|nr:intradiol ring-cleavage dioxygenase [Thermomicrobiales bacterium]